MNGTSVLVYVRPWSRDYFRYVCPRVFPQREIHYVSDFRGLGSFPLMERFYGYFNSSVENFEVPAWLTAGEECDVIMRSFLLRAMRFDKARKFVRCMSKAIDEMLVEIEPEQILLASGDSYVVHLLFKDAVFRKIPICGLMAAPFPGYARASAMGEYFAFRDVSDAECRASMEKLLANDYLPNDFREWMRMFGGSAFHLKRAVREIPKRYYFPLLGRIKKDPCNYHYLASATSRVSVISQSLLIARHYDRDWMQRLEGWQGTKVYFPLQVFPESTTDYHVEEIDLIDFPRLLPRILGILSEADDILVCVKEHPGNVGTRPPNFYETLKGWKNVVMIPSEVESIGLIQKTDIVLTWTGTTGLEAGLRGKPVVTMGKPYYSSGRLFGTVKSARQLAQLPRMIRAMRQAVGSADESMEITRHCLECAFPGEFMHIGFDATDARLKQKADSVVAGLGEHLESWRKAFRRNYGA